MGVVPVAVRLDLRPVSVDGGLGGEQVDRVVGVRRRQAVAPGGRRHPSEPVVGIGDGRERRGAALLDGGVQGGVGVVAVGRHGTGDVRAAVHQPLVVVVPLDHRPVRVSDRDPVAVRVVGVGHRPGLVRQGLRLSGTRLLGRDVGVRRGRHRAVRGGCLRARHLTGRRVVGVDQDVAHRVGLGRELAGRVVGVCRRATQRIGRATEPPRGVVDVLGPCPRRLPGLLPGSQRRSGVDHRRVVECDGGAGGPRGHGRRDGRRRHCAAGGRVVGGCHEVVGCDRRRAADPVVADLLHRIGLEQRPAARDRVCRAGGRLPVQGVVGGPGVLCGSLGAVTDRRDSGGIGDAVVAGVGREPGRSGCRDRSADRVVRGAGGEPAQVRGAHRRAVLAVRVGRHRSHRGIGHEGAVANVVRHADDTPQVVVGRLGEMTVRGVHHRGRLRGVSRRLVRRGRGESGGRGLLHQSACGVVGAAADPTETVDGLHGQARHEVDHRRRRGRGLRPGADRDGDAAGRLRGVERARERRRRRRRTVAVVRRCRAFRPGQRARRRLSEIVVPVGHDGAGGQGSGRGRLRLGRGLDGLVVGGQRVRLCAPGAVLARRHTRGHQPVGRVVRGDRRRPGLVRRTDHPTVVVVLVVGRHRPRRPRRRGEPAGTAGRAVGDGGDPRLVVVRGRRRERGREVRVTRRRVLGGDVSVTHRLVLNGHVCGVGGDGHLPLDQPVQRVEGRQRRGLTVRDLGRVLVVRVGVVEQRVPGGAEVIRITGVVVPVVVFRVQ